MLSEDASGRRYRKVFDKYRDFTMVGRESFVKNLALVEQLTPKEGCIVECGVWRGGVSGAQAELLGTQRKYYLFDSFEGLPDAKPVDGKEAIAWQQDKSSPYYFDNCRAEQSFAENAMKLAGACNVEIVKGWFSDTVPGYSFESEIALLRLDGDWYDSTMVCLEHLYPKVRSGGLIVIDDYYTWDGCAFAVHEYLSRIKSTARIRQAYATGCYFIKP